MVDGRLTVADEKCTNCGECVRICANDAVEMVLDAVPVEAAVIEPPGIVEIHPTPVAQTSAGTPATRPAGGWLSMLGRAAGMLGTFLVDRALESRNTPRGMGGCSRRGQMNRMRRRGR